MGVTGLNCVDVTPTRIGVYPRVSPVRTIG